MKEYTTQDSAHGRIETRRIRVVPADQYYQDWHGIKQICQIKRSTWKKDKKSIDYAYAITSLPPETHGPKQLLEINREHWAVESFHWLKDTILNEDASTIRTKNAPETLSLIRSLKLFLIKKFGFKHKEGHEFLFNNHKLIEKLINKQCIKALN